MYEFGLWTAWVPHFSESREVPVSTPFWRRSGRAILAIRSLAGGVFRQFGGNGCSERNLLGDLNAEAFQADYFPRVIRQEMNRG